MKKIIFAFFALAALAFTSCEKNTIKIMDLDASKFDNTTEYCWHVTQTDRYGVEKVYFIWDTEQGLIKQLQALAQSAIEVGQDVKSSYKKTTIGDYDSCYEKMLGGF